MSEPRKPAPLTARVLTVVTWTLLSWALSGPPDLMADGGPMILSLGDDSYITWSEVEMRTGATVRKELEDLPLADFSVIILSNVSYASLPAAVRDGLSEYLAYGGSLLVTGGKQSYGSGGYVGTELAELLPLKPSRDDFGYNPYGPTLLLQPRHPILQGVTLPPMGYFNELELNSGAVEIAQYRKGSKAAFTGGRDPGGGEIGGGGRRTMPLIAEKSVGQGTILAIAIDMALSLDKDIWKDDRDRFAQNCVEHLLQRSRIEPAKLPKEPVAK